MKVLYSWLQDYVDIPWGPEELAEKLTMAGLEVEEIIPFPRFDEKIRVGKIISVENHPHSDHLFICRTDVGEHELSIVCGAPNVKPGIVAPVALPGAMLPQLPNPIGESIIRGVVSQGMICSEKELGISDDHSGVMVLANDQPIGMPFTAPHDKKDSVLDISITPNRGDCLSVIGIARELAALSGGRIRFPEFSIQEDSETTADLISVRLMDKVGCPRYSARIIRDIAIGESPHWMRKRLEACGLRAINNIVDITNYVLLEVGQPLHAFDLTLIRSGKIIVRSGMCGETFITLDNVARTLSEKNLLICDGDRPIALAGVMGGVDTEITPSTTHVLLESAFFNQKRIRQSSAFVSLSTEASRRFERGVDPDRIIWASERASAFMQGIGGGRVLRGVAEVNRMPKSGKKIGLRQKRCAQILGIDLEKSEIISALQRSGCDVREGKTLQATIPGYRWDLTREIDLIEEIARIAGYHRIPANMQSVIAVEKASGKTREYAFDFLRNIMIGLGFYEVTNNIMGRKFFEYYLSDNEDQIRLANPLNEDMAILRPSIIPSLIEALEWNRNRGTDNVRIFELGKVFRKSKSGYSERYTLAGLLTGEAAPKHWSQSQVLIEFYEFKGIIETILLKIFLDSFEFFRYDKTDFDEAFSVVSNGEKIGYMGKLSDIYHDCTGISSTYVFELEVEPIMRKILERNPVYKPISKFPLIKRDLVLLIDDNIQVGDIIESIRNQAGPYLNDLSIFDLYKGKQVPEGKKSLGFALSFGSSERTLPESDVNEVMERILQFVEQKHQALLRPF